MVNGFIDIHKLNMEELHGVITLYPWFGAARTELCRRMSELGEGAWSDESYADAALYVSSRKIIAELAHKGHETQYADADIRALLRAYITEDVASARTDVKRKPGGDYFTREEYESVKKEGDADFARFAKVNENALWRARNLPISAPKPSRKFTPDRAITSRRDKFIRNLVCVFRKKVLTLRPLLKN